MILYNILAVHLIVKPMATLWILFVAFRLRRPRPHALVLWRPHPVIMWLSTHAEFLIGVSCMLNQPYTGH